MAIVWQNSFDGVPGTNLTVANSADWGNPIAGLRNNPPSNAVRYGDRSIMGRSSMRLGTPDAAAHGNVWLYYPTGSEYSVSFYLYLPEGGWFRMRDANVVVEFYLATASQSYIGDSHPVPDAVRDAVFDRWTRVEISTISTRTEYRMWWTDPQSTGTPDYVYEHARDGGVIDGIFTQGAGDSGTTTPYLDQVRIGEGEWLGPWPEQHTTVALEGSMGMSGQLTAEGVEDDHTRLLGESHLSAPPVAASKHTRVGLSAAIDLGAATPVAAKGAVVGLSSDVGEIEAPELTPSKASTVALEGVMELDGDADVRGTFRPTFPPRIVTEILIDDMWEDISEDVYVRDPVHLTRGRADEAVQSDPSALSLTLNNRDGRYSPRNPLSPYYGKLGRNTPIQIRMGDLPDEDPAVVEDSFDRTVGSGGWGTADSGQVWTTSSSIPNVFSVSDGRGRISLPNSDWFYPIRMTDPNIPADVDVRYTVEISDYVQGDLNAGIYAEVGLREGPDPNRGGYLLEMSYRSAAGMSQGIGLVMASISKRLDGVNTQLMSTTAVVGVTYTPGQPLNVRVQADGPNFRVRLWNQGDVEPEVWHAQGWDDEYTEGGVFHMGANVTSNVDASDTPEISFSDLEVTPMYYDPEVIRITGEVASWPVRWDVSDTDVWVPLEAAGIKRRLNQGRPNFKSPLRAGIEPTGPVAYWPMEDGINTRAMRAVSPQTTDMRAIGVRFATDDSLQTSLALPTAGLNSRLTAGGIPTRETGSWSVHMVLKLSIPSFETGEAVQDTLTEVFAFDTTNHRYRVYVGANDPGGDDESFFMWAAVFDSSDDSYGSRLAPANFTAGNTIFIDDLDFDVRESWVRLALSGWQYTPTQAAFSFQLVTADNQSEGASFAFNGQTGRVTSINTNIGAGLEGTGFGHLTVWDALSPPAYFNAFGGWAGEGAQQRMTRVAAQNGIPLVTEGAAKTRLGPQVANQALETITEAANSDLGALVERRAGLSLSYRGREDLYNQEPVITLDYANGELNPPLEPVDDDQNLRNSVEVTRAGGGSALVEQREGPLGINTAGLYDESVTLSLATDTQARDQAGWRLHMGTVDEMRWPVLHINLANRRLGLRIEDILNLDVGDRIRVLNPPTWTQYDHLDLIVQGYEEIINLFQWDIILTCTPATVWTVGEMGTDDPSETPPDAPSRADTADSELASGIGTGATTFDVVTNQGPTWVDSAEYPDDLPFDIEVGGEVMQVDEIESATSPQTFTVQRSMNGIVKSHEAGSAVRLANPAIAGL